MFIVSECLSGNVRGWKNISRSSFSRWGGGGGGDRG